MTDSEPDASALLDRSLESGRIHSAYLLSGPGPRPVAEALRFVRALVCSGPPGPRPCEACPDCRRSATPNDVALDGTGRSGPLLRHVGDHADLLWVARGSDDTRVRIAQIRALQAKLRLRTSGDGRRAAVIEGAEWLNAESQNALLRLLEEPPPETSLVLVAGTAAGLLATLRSRCQRVAFPATATTGPEGEDAVALRARLRDAGGLSIPELLDWAEEYRGARSEVAEAVEALVEEATACLHLETRRRVQEGARDLSAPLRAFSAVRAARRGLVQRNANPQMTAERVLLALRGALS